MIMKQVKIKKLSASNFRGQNFNDSYGNTNFISGRNSAGKSTRIAAWNWLICGCCSANEVANYNLFNNKEVLSPQTPSAIVEALVEIDGVEYKLCRKATPAYIRKRGTNEEIKSPSDNYEYFVDNISYSAGEYKDWLSANICQDDMLKYVLDGSFFVDLVFSDKKRARTIIEKTVGTVERSEMKGNYADIDELLKKFSPDQIEEQSKNLSKSIDARLNEIPTVISQKEAEISEIKQTDFTAIQNEIDTLEGEQKSIEEKIFDYSARMKPLLEAKAKAESDKGMKQEVYDKAKKTYMQGFIDQDNNLCTEISRIEKETEEKKSRIAELKRANDSDKITKDEHKKELDKVRARIEEIKSRKYNGASACPVCGRELPQEMQEKSMNDFYEKNKEELGYAVASGKARNEYIKTLETAIDKRQEEINSIVFEDAEPLKQKLSTLRTSDIAPFELTEQGKSLQSDIDAVIIPEVKMPEDAELKQQAADIKEKLKGLYMKKGLKIRLSSLETDIDELRSEQREKGAELAMYERRRQLVKDFKQEQMEILSHKVNDSLDCSSIECWSQQKDGTMVSDLVLKNSEGVNFATANQASRILTTCDIQRFFCKKLGVQMPVFIDESSTIQESNLPLYDNTQTFYLFCSDEPLKIETR
jgi:DNA repair exonuclease SbcCD ATPase subunit